MSPSDRREFQRLRLDEGIRASFKGHEVRIVEIGVIGARIEHREPHSDGSGTLRFEWAGETIDLEGTPVWTDEAASGEGFHTGLRFSRALGESDESLRRMLTARVKQLLERYRGGKVASVTEDVDADETLRGKVAAFVTYSMEDGAWRKAPSLLPDQPEAGFTVAVGHDEDEIALLCQAYEDADSDGMQLIKMFAELSVSEALGVPPRK